MSSQDSPGPLEPGPGPGTDLRPSSLLLQLFASQRQAETEMAARHERGQGRESLSVTQEPSGLWSLRSSYSRHTLRGGKRAEDS